MKQLLVIIGLSVGVWPSGAGEPAARNPAALLAPWFDDQAIAAVHVDLSKLGQDDIRIVGVELEKLGLDARDLQRARTLARDWVGGLANAKVKSVFVVVSLKRPEQPYVLVPVGEGANRAAVERLLGTLSELDQNYKVEARDGYVLAGHASSLKHLQHAPRAVPELAPAFAAVGDHPIQVVVRAPAILRKALLETMPALPRELGGGSTAELNRAVKWGAAGLTLAPASVRLVAQARDAESAQAVQQAIGHALTALRAAAKNVPEAGTFFDLLEPRLDKDRLVVSLDDKTLAKVLVPMAAKLRAQAERAVSGNNLRQIAIAMHAYYDGHKSFPTPANYNAEGKALLSWRVHLLPYLEQQPLYNQFKLNEPWDSPHNRGLIAKMPAIFAAPGHKHAAEGKTCYQVPVGKDTIFPGKKGITFREITDGTSNTILVLETNDDQAVIWTKPGDWEFNDKEPLRGLLRAGTKGFSAAFADGSERTIPSDLRPEVMRALITRSGGEVIPDF